MRGEESRTPPRDGAVRRILVEMVAEDRQRHRKPIRPGRPAWFSLVVLLMVGLGVGIVSHARLHHGTPGSDPCADRHVEVHLVQTRSDV